MEPSAGYSCRVPDRILAATLPRRHRSGTTGSHNHARSGHLVAVLKIVSQVESSGELSSRSSAASPRSCLLGPEQMTHTSADVTAVARSAGEGRPRGIAQCSAKTESEVEGSCGEAGSSWPGADDTTIAGVTTVLETVGESRPLPGIARGPFGAEHMT